MSQHHTARGHKGGTSRGEMESDWLKLSTMGHSTQASGDYPTQDEPNASYSPRWNNEVP